MELISEIYNLPLNTLYLGMILGLIFKLLWNWKINHSPVSLNRTHAETRIRFSEVEKPNNYAQQHFIIFWITRCLKRKENSRDEEDDVSVILPAQRKIIDGMPANFWYISNNLLEAFIYSKKFSCTEE